MPDVVVTFINAVSNIPELTDDSIIEVSDYISSNVQSTYDALLGTEFIERDDVKVAESTYLSILRKIEEMSDTEAEEYAYPTAIDDSILKSLKVGVRIECDMPNCEHAPTNYTLTTSKGKDAKTVGPIQQNTGDDKDKYPYMCDIRITVDQQNNFWLKRNMQDGGVWDTIHMLRYETNELLVTLYWDGSKWVNIHSNNNQWYFMEIHCKHNVNTDNLLLNQKCYTDSKYISNSSDELKLYNIDGDVITYNITIDNDTCVDLTDMLIRTQLSHNVHQIEYSATVDGTNRNVTFIGNGGYRDYIISGDVNYGSRVVLTYKVKLPSRSDLVGIRTFTLVSRTRAFANYTAGSRGVSYVDVSPVEYRNIEVPSGYEKSFGGYNSCKSIFVIGDGLWIPKVCYELEDIRVLIYCKDDIEHNTGYDWYNLYGNGSVEWYDKWRTIGPIVDNKDGTFGCAVTFHTIPWANMRISGQKLTNYKDDTGISHIFYGTTINNGSVNVTTDNSVTDVDILFTYKDGRWVTDTESVIVWLKEDCNMLSIKYMCDESNSPFSSGNYSYRLIKGHNYNHEVDSTKTVYPQVKDFANGYKSPKSFNTTPSSPNTWVYDEVLTDESSLSGTMNDEDINLEVWYSRDNKGVLNDIVQDVSDGIPDKYQIRATFKVVNGEWENGTSDDVVVYVTKYNNGTMSVDGNADVSTIMPGVSPGNGSWDVTPNKVKYDTVFTYTYSKDDTNTDKPIVPDDTIQDDNPTVPDDKSDVVQDKPSDESYDNINTTVTDESLNIGESTNHTTDTGSTVANTNSHVQEDGLSSNAYDDIYTIPKTGDLQIMIDTLIFISAVGIAVTLVFDKDDKYNCK